MKEDLLVPVLDGETPEMLSLGETTLPVMAAALDAAAAERADELEAEARFRLALLIEPPERILSREGNEWSHVVGVLIDGTGDDAARSAAAKRAVEVYRNVHSVRGVATKLQRFCIAVLATDPAVPNKVWNNYSLALKKDAEFRFKFEINPQVARSADVFHSIMTSFDLQIIYSTMFNDRELDD